MLNRVNLNIVWQFQLVGPRGEDFDDLVWSYLIVAQLTARATSDNILCVEPYSISFLQSWGWSPPPVCCLAITVLCAEDLSLEKFLDIFQLSCRFVCVSFCRYQGSLFVLSVVEWPVGVVPVVCEEGGHACRFRGLVICRELGEGSPRIPVVLKVVDKAPEVLFHDSIEPFSLSVGQGVIRG